MGLYQYISIQANIQRNNDYVGWGKNMTVDDNRGGGAQMTP